MASLSALSLRARTELEGTIPVPEQQQSSVVVQKSERRDSDEQLPYYAWATGMRISYALMGRLAIFH
jgi:hypothetical protein